MNTLNIKILGLGLLFALLFSPWSFAGWGKYIDQYDAIIRESGIPRYDEYKQYQICTARDCWGLYIIGHVQIDGKDKTATKEQIGLIKEVLTTQYDEALALYKENQEAYKEWKRENPDAIKKEYPEKFLPKPKKPSVKISGKLTWGGYFTLKDSRPNVRYISPFRAKQRIKLLEEIIGMNKKVLKKNQKVIEKMKEFEALTEAGLNVDPERLNEYVGIPTNYYGNDDGALD